MIESDDGFLHGDNLLGMKRRVCLLVYDFLNGYRKPGRKDLSWGKQEDDLSLARTEQNNVNII